MTKTEILAFLDAQLKQLEQRGIVATGLTRKRVRDEWVGMSTARGIIAKHMPNDVPPGEQRGLKGVG